MEKEVVRSKKAPQAIGAYSQVIKLDKMLYSSGQIALDASTNTLVEGEIEAQTKKVMDNIAHLLEESHSSFGHVVKMTLYLTNMNDFKEVNGVYQSYFSESYPARSTLEVARLPMNALIEIDFIAYCP